MVSPQRSFTREVKTPGQAKALLRLRLTALLLARGCTRRKMMGEMGLTEDGVKRRVQTFIKAMGAVNSTEAVALAYEKGLLKVGDHATPASTTMK